MIRYGPHWLGLSVLALLLAAPGALAAEPAPPAPAPAALPAAADAAGALADKPAATALADARRVVRDTFRAELAARADADRRATAQKLLDLGRQTAGEPASRYALYLEARDLAADAGDARTALAAVDALREGYRLDPAELIDLKITAVLKAAPKATTADPAHDLAVAALAALGDALAADDFTAATRLGVLGPSRALTLAGPEGDALRARLLEVRKIADQYQQLKPALDKLAKNPDDADANLAVGRYQCFYRNDWKAGLPHLAKGADAALAALASSSLAPPADPAPLKALADQWWDLAEKTPDPAKARLRSYAGGLYKQALPGLTGLTKVVAEKRSAEADAVPAPAAKPGAGGRRVVNLIPLIDPAKDTEFGGWHIDKGVLYCDTQGLVPRLRSSYQPPEEYDVRLVFTQARVRNPVGVLLPNRHGEVFHADVGATRPGGAAFSLAAEGNGPPPPFPRPQVIIANRPHTLVVEVRKAAARIVLDGRVLAEYKGDFGDLKTDVWHRVKDKTVLTICCDDPTVFTVAEATEIGGTGKVARPPER